MNKNWIPIFFATCVLVGCQHPSPPIAIRLVDTPIDTPVPSPTPTPPPSNGIQPTPPPVQQVSPSPSFDAHDLTGTWKMERSRTTLPEENEEQRQYDEAFQLAITSDGKYMATGISYPGPGTWVVSGNQVFLEADDHREPMMVFRYNPSDQTMTMDKPTSTTTYYFVVTKK